MQMEINSSPERTNAKNHALLLFFILTAGSLLLSLVYLAGTSGTALDYVIFQSGKDRFMDFFNSISYASDPAKTYFISYHSSFPALAYCLYYLFSLVLPEGSVTLFYPGATSSYALLLFVIYNAVLATLLLYAISRYFDYESQWKALLMALVCLSANCFVTGVFERGNSVFIVLILLLFAMRLRNSESAFKRETALVFIAIAAGFKLYPAAFGLLYIAEKRWKESARLLIYGALFFFLPFFYFGGTEGLTQFFKNQIELQKHVMMSSHDIPLFLYSLGKDFGIELFKNWTFMIGASLCYLTVSFWAVTGHREPWKRIMLLTGVMILCPAWSAEYTLAYNVVPLVFFAAGLKGQDKFTDYFFSICFACIMSFFLIGNNPKMPEFTRTETINYAGMYILNIYLIIEGVYLFFRNGKSRKAT